MASLPAIRYLLRLQSVVLQVYEDTSGLTVGDGVVRTGKVGLEADHLDADAEADLNLELADLSTGFEHRPQNLGSAPAAQNPSVCPAHGRWHAHGRALCHICLLSFASAAIFACRLSAASHARSAPFLGLFPRLPLAD